MVLIGVLIVIVGFALRINPLLVVTVAGIATGLLAHESLYSILSQFGAAFAKDRYMAVFIATLPVIGLLERHGLREQAQHLVSRVRAATTGRILNAYLFIREAAAALGLTSIGGPAQMVRPVVAPMAEGAALAKYGKLPDDVRDHIRAHAAAVDNVGLFFGEDVFVAVGAVLLMKGVFDQFHIHATPILMGLWALPTAIAVFMVHSVRLYLLDRRLRCWLSSDSSVASASPGEGVHP
ncbi:DUF969 domain-containing protein [Alicyclobacillus sendaiensis]|uniref:DUF969 domain-containing protein n=1 Tax=Alicyclobacillus sendaiensis TaxID=192387 RepID=UPI0007844914|nr:DUF969 domain-containing protein [Alicyclobacillus sendaiensis]